MMGKVDPADHLRLAYFVASRYRSTLPLEDRKQVACEALLKAAAKFDPARGFAFSTYAKPGMIHDLTAASNGDAAGVRVPHYQWTRNRKAARRRDEMRVELGREPSDAEVAADVDVALDLLQATQVACRRPGPLVAPNSANDDPERPEYDPPDQAARDPEAQAITSSERAELAEALAGLNPRWAEVVALRYGARMKLRDVGKIVGLSHERCRQIADRALDRLREVLCPSDPRPPVHA